MTQKFPQKELNKNENIVISNLLELEKTKTAMREQGTAKLHVLSDFDRTLTQALVDGQIVSTAFAQFRNGNYLTADYAPRAYALFDIYRPIEIDPNIPLEEKKQKMHEWWFKHLELLVECGLNKDVMLDVVKKREIVFRAGALEFIDLLHKKNIPLVIMSAAPGDMIRMMLEREGRLYANVHIIANMFEFDATGRVVAIKEPIIHSLNKDETAIQGFPVFELIRERKNVLLLGDGVGDTGMIEGFTFDNLIKVGFLNEKAEENLESFKNNFDVILTGDTDMDFVLNLATEILQ
jgi:5'-nucleotidase